MEVARIITEEQQAVCLTGLLVLSLVLPLLIGALLRKRDRAPEGWMRMVWLGQLLLGVSGVFMIAMPSHAGIALLIAAVLCAVFAVILRRQFRCL